MNKKDLLYTGKAKAVYATEDANLVIIHYNDDATAGNGAKHDVISGKGILNNKISTLIFKILKDAGIPSHHRQILNEREQLCEKVSIIPLEVITRNVLAGSTAKHIGVAEGTVPPNTIVELCYKNDELGDPLINDDHAVALNAASYEELEIIYDWTDKINQILVALFAACGVRLIDFKLEFGKNAAGEIVLADEISPDTCRLWDINSNEKLDKDRFRRDLGGLREAYEDILSRLQALEEKNEH